MNLEKQVCSLENAKRLYAHLPPRKQTDYAMTNQSLLASIESRFRERFLNRNAVVYGGELTDEQTKHRIEYQSEEALAFIKQSHEEIIQAVVEAIDDKYAKGPPPSSWAPEIQEMWYAMAAQHNKDLDDLKNTLLQAKSTS